MIVIIRHGNSGAARQRRLKNVSSSICQEKTITCCKWQAFGKRAHLLQSCLGCAAHSPFPSSNLDIKANSKQRSTHASRQVSVKETNTQQNKLLAAKDPFEPSWSSRRVDSPYRPVDSKRDPFDHRRPWVKAFGSCWNLLTSGLRCLQHIAGRSSYASLIYRFWCTFTRRARLYPCLLPPPC